MNGKLKLPFHLGVDRHNRVPLGDGHPMLRATRNLMLDDRNELVRRNAMEYRKLLIRSDQSSGGLFGGVSAGSTEDGATGGRTPQDPLCLWLPPFTGTVINIDGSLTRSAFSVFDCVGGTRLLVADGESTIAPMPSVSRYKPQAVMWHGALWIVVGDACINKCYAHDNPNTGIIRVGEYTPNNGVPTLDVTEGMGVDISGSWITLFSDGALGQDAAMLRPKVIGTYRGRMILGNFPKDSYNQPHRNGFIISDFLPAGPSYGSGALSLVSADVPVFAAGGTSPWYSGQDGREFRVGDDEEELVASRELSLMQLGAMNQSCNVFFKDRSIWVMTGEPLSTVDVGAVKGDAVFIKQPLADGCASAETIAETPWGPIWAGHEDVYFMPNGGGAPIPIGRRIAKQLANTPPDMQWRWHAVYHKGWYRLFIMAINQRQDAPLLMEECWCLDLRYGPPQDWTQARWFGPQVYQPIGAPNGHADDIYRGVGPTAVDLRAGVKPELFSIQPGMDGGPGDADVYAWVMCGLDGEETRDWSCPFGPLQTRAAGSAETVELGELRIMADTSWPYGRFFKCVGAGTSDTGELDMGGLDAQGESFNDGGVSWQFQGKVAVPRTWNRMDTNDGEDAFPTNRGNEILFGIRGMEFGAEQENRMVQLRGLEIGATRADDETFVVTATKDGLHEGATLRYRYGVGNFRLAQTALGERINDPIAPFTIWVDSPTGYAINPLGQHVSFMLHEYPYFTLWATSIPFSFYFDADENAESVSPFPPFTVTPANTTELLVPAVLTLGLGTQGFYPGQETAFGGGLLDAIVAAMNQALLDNNLPGSFSHNMTGVAATDPVRPAITHSTNNWAPNCYAYNFESSQDGDSPRLWLELGFEAVGVGIGSDYRKTIVAPFSPWAAKVPKIRIANLSVITRSFRRGPV